MAVSRLALSITGAIAGALLELLLFLPGSPAGLYFEATFGVSNVVIITVLVAALGIIILFASILVIAMAVAKWRQTFNAEIVEKKRFLLGESVFFKAFFKGKLSQGFFTCKVSLPNGRQEWWPAYDTFQRSEEGDVGVLSGQDVHEAKWGFQIPRGFPTGEYRVQIGVWDRKDSSSDNAPVKEKSASFWVLPPGYKGSPGVSTVIEVKPQPEQPQNLPSTIDEVWYQNKVKEELLEIRVKLDETNDPKDIYFSIWNEKVYQARKKGWIGNQTNYNAIEFFSSCLNERNTFLRHALENYGYESTSPIIKSDFLKLNGECIRAYSELITIRFLPKGLAPQIEVTLVKAESEIFKEFQVRLKNGIERVPARICFITVKNLTGPTIRDLEVDFRAHDVKSQKQMIHPHTFLMVFSSGADHLTLYCEDTSVKHFKESADALRIALINVDNEKLASRRTILHQGNIGRTFALIMTMDDPPYPSILTIPSYHTRSTVWIPCSFIIDLYLTGDTLPSTRVARFQVQVDDWKSPQVKQIILSEGQLVEP